MSLGHWSLTSPCLLEQLASSAQREEGCICQTFWILVSHQVKWNMHWHSCIDITMWTPSSHGTLSVSWCFGSTGVVVTEPCVGWQCSSPCPQSQSEANWAHGVKPGTAGRTLYLRKPNRCQGGISWHPSKIIKCYGFAMYDFYPVKILHWCWQSNIQTNRLLFHIYCKSLISYFEKRAAMFISCWIRLFFNSKQASSRKRSNLIPKAGT